MNEQAETFDKLAFWENILRAAGADPKKPRRIRGASGQYHDVLALGVDEDRNRLVLVSGEHDARSAVLAQYDIQSAIPNMRVLTVRPALISVPKVAQALVAVLGTPEFTLHALGKLVEDSSEFRDAVLHPSLGGLKTVAKNVKISRLPQILELIQQLAEIRIHASDVKEELGTDDITFDLSRLVGRDPTEEDRAYGVCAVPFYEITADDIETIASGESFEDVINILRARDIFQFFFPAADSLALGLLDRGIEKRESVEGGISTTESLGHPLGELEIVSADTAQRDLIDALKDKGLVVEGEYAFEVSEEGKKIRANVKFKPKEGIVSKLINRFSISLDLKGLFGR